MPEGKFTAYEELARGERPDGPRISLSLRILTRLFPNTADSKKHLEGIFFFKKNTDSDYCGVKVVERSTVIISFY